MRCKALRKEKAKENSRFGNFQIWDLSIRDSLEPSNFLFHLIGEDLDILYLLQTKETE